MLLIVVAADLLIYRGHGYSGVSVLLMVVPLILLPVTPNVRFGWGVWCAAGVLLLFAFRMSWHGWPAMVR